MSPTLFSSYSPAAVAATKVSCRRGGRLLFRPVSFALKAGEVLSLEGVNGAGKTTLLRCLAGFIRPASGALAWNHTEVAPYGAMHGQLAYIGHRDAIKPALTVKDNVDWQAKVYGITGRSGIALAFFQLTRRAALPAGFLSAGWRRRLALARLIAVPRPLWLLDEPLTALDAAGHSLFFGLLDAHLNAGGLAIIAHHGKVIGARAHSQLYLEPPDAESA